MTGLAALGAQLRAGGLSPRALAAWVGTDRVAAVPGLLATRARATPAPAALALFVDGAELALDRLRGLPVASLIEHGLLEHAGDRVRARVAIVPLGPSLLVCDRRDATDERDLVCWPDDSSHHLANAIPPGRRARWLDLGCGSAFAQLARPALATELAGVDINPRALAFATLGAGLSGIDRARFAGTPGDDTFDLVTCNAPLPAADAAAVWRAADAGFFAWLWPAITAQLAPGGLAVVHAARSAIPDTLAGERTIVAYADEAILWWRPDAADDEVATRRALTPERPHVEARDLDDARARHR
ncbi:MAG: hypothetical protein WKG01_22105 [Kofleriaceae bacterium]